jgi:NADH:ubiquinone oxidoreductase subunit F (NADH-binding)
MMNSAAPTSTARSSAGSGRPAVQPPAGAERLLGGVGTQGAAVGLAEHLDRWGSVPTWRGTAFLDELDASGLRGHGGAWFPVGTKWRSVRKAGLRSPVVVANGAEGEPASGKDRVLVQQLPHLVLDGAVLAAATVGAGRVYVHVPSGAVPAVSRAIEERRQAGLDPCDIEVVVAPDRFLAGQETAAVATIIGRKPATPTFVGLKPVREQGVGGRPTLVQNVESLAHAALIARFGAEWFRRVGTSQSPGTVLLTVTGRWAEPRIVEAPLGVPLGEILQLGLGDARSFQGVLLGGYGGGWVTPKEALAMPLTEEAARQYGSSIGAGVVALLPTNVCPLSEVSRVVTYLEGQGAGQCGPCVNGLAVLANAVSQLAHRPNALRGGVAAIPSLCGLVEGRGACRHPDGVARFVRTALRVYGDHAGLHLQRGPCHTSASPFLPIPRTAPRQGAR